MFKKLFAGFGIAAGSALSALAMSAQAHAAAFAVSTSTLNNQTGGYLQTTYDYVSSQLADGGLFLFGVVITILTIVIWLAWNKLRHIFG